MRRIYLLYFLFLFSARASFAELQDSSNCFHSFSTNGMEMAEPSIHTSDINSLINNLRSKTQPLDRKQDIIKLLPVFHPDQLISLFSAILNLNTHYQTQFLDLPFTQALMSSTKEQIPHLDKNQLIQILYFYKEMGLKPDETFTYLWRQASLEKQREFQSFERYYIRIFFIELGIPPLKNPHDLNSGYVEAHLN